MKIAICGIDEKANEKVIEDFMKKFTMYKSPIENIHNPDLNVIDKEPEYVKKDLYEKMTEIEKFLYNKLLLVKQQTEQNKKEGYVIYNGTSYDILMMALTLNGITDLVSDAFVEKVIYYNKKFLRDIDAIYWLPYIGEEELSDENSMVENCYANVFMQYRENFHACEFFNHNDCPSIITFETDDYVGEISMLLDKNGNLDDGTNPSDSQRLKEIFKNNPDALKAINEGIEKNGGVLKTVGSIPLDLR